MAGNIFNVLYTDYVKPLEKLIITLLVFIIFVIAGYYGYIWYVKSTIENYDAEDMSNNNRRVSEANLKFFFADWCPHCKRAKPEWEKFMNEYNGKEEGYYKISCETIDCSDGDNSQIQEYSIDGYPTVFMLKDNKRVNYDAKITEPNLKQFVEDFLKN
jgi:thiol-disulfide isomerase/thioredoxin